MAGNQKGQLPIKASSYTYCTRLVIKNDACTARFMFQRNSYELLLENHRYEPMRQN